MEKIRIALASLTPILLYLLSVTAPNAKEEKYQDGFLKDVFESCLGYTLDSTNLA